MFWIILLVILLLLDIIRIYYKKKNFPPGPWAIPIFGSFISDGCRLGARMMMDSHRWIPKYGKLIGYLVGPTFQRWIIIQDFALAKEAVNHNKLQTRYEGIYSADIRGYDGKPTGIILTEGHPWKVTRRFTSSKLKDFGFGKSSMDKIIQEEAFDAISVLAKHNGQDFLIKQTFNVYVFNIIWKLTSGDRVGNDKNKLITELAESLSVIFKYLFLPTFFPFLPEKLSGAEIMRKHIKKIKNMFEEEIKEHIETFDPNNLRDFMDAYIAEMQKDDSDKEVFNTKTLVGCCLDFFEGGVETICSTLSWFLMCMALNQDVQDKCREEIFQKIGLKRPDTEDKVQLPYTVATIMEVQRLCSVTVAGTGTVARERLELFGYDIPANTRLYYNIYRFHTDPDYWEDPLKFMPERFLNEDMTEVLTKEQFMPYGFGKRMCIGISLAKAELFIFCTALLQHMKISPPHNNSQLDMENFDCGFTRSPRPFYVHLDSTSPQHQSS